MDNISLLTDAGTGGDVRLIGDLVNVVGLEPKTIRYYEREGLLKPRRVGHLRVYDVKDIERLKVIKFLRQFDVSIQLIKNLLTRYRSIVLDELPDEAKSAVGGQLQKRKDELVKLEALWDRVSQASP